MTKYLLNRILQTVLIVVIVSVISFLLVSIMPKDPVYALIGADATEEDYWTTYYRLGLDKPLFIRYFNWAAGAVSGDFGTSYAYNLPVWEVLGPKLAVTIYLSVVAMLISFPLGIILGIISAVRRGKMSDTVITLIANLMSGIPQFVVAICLLYLFSMKLRLLPAIGFTFPWEDFPRHIKQIILPLTCLVLQSAAGICRQTRSSMLEAYGQDYVRTARSKGLKEGFIIYKHVMGNGLIPIITLIGGRLSSLIGGAMFVEAVFSIPGMGSLMVTAINSMDIPVIQATVLVTAVVISAAYIITDILYVIVDPRISLN